MHGGSNTADRKQSRGSASRICLRGRHCFRARAQRALEANMDSQEWYLLAKRLTASCPAGCAHIFVARWGIAWVILGYTAIEKGIVKKDSRMFLLLYLYFNRYITGFVWMYGIVATQK